MIDRIMLDLNFLDRWKSQKIFLIAMTNTVDRYDASKWLSIFDLCYI